MKVIEHLERAKSPLISFEIVPLPRGGDIRLLFGIIDELIKFHPPFIDVTSHAAEVYYEETKDGIKKKTKRKKPGTIGISVAIKNKYSIDTVPHILCTGFTREETEDALIELNYLGIENVLAVRGDDKGNSKPIPKDKTVNCSTHELVEQIVAMNKAKYLDEDLLDATPSDFCIGVGGYPEKHFESPNLKSDLTYLKKKVDAGADYIVTQMFFKNEYYYKFVDDCRKAGITVPIIPGLKVLSNKKHLHAIPRNFFVEIPDELAEEIEKAEKDQIADIGAEWALKQTEDLLNNGAPSIHFYIMQYIKPIQKVLNKLKLNL